MKFKKSILANLLAFAMIGAVGFGSVVQSACVVSSNNSQQTSPEVKTFSVKYNTNGGDLPENSKTTFTEGQGFVLPIPTKDDFEFAGWYNNPQFSGEKYTEITAAEANADKEFWAKWEDTNTGEKPGGEGDSGTTDDGKKDPDDSGSTGGETLGGQTGETGGSGGDDEHGGQTTPQTFTVMLEYNGGRLKDGETFESSYTEGTEITLPEPVKDDYTFDGWYKTDNFSGNKVTSVTVDGNLKFYAKWTEVQKPAPGVTIKEYGGYEEGAYVILDCADGSTAADYTVKYRPSDGVSGYTELDAELVRKEGDEIRADILGLKKGSYTIQATYDGKTATVENVEVAAYDRSGYAHFDYNDGVGAYKNDGTLKKDAVIIYVTEETKNTVKAKIENSYYEGIVNILNSASKSKVPLVIRVIGTVGAATWNEIDYEKYSLDKIKGINGKPLPQKETTQQQLIDGGYNTLDTTVYSELKGLSSKITWSSDKKEFDSAWNNCIVQTAQNVTVEGVGKDARIFQWGFTWKKCNSIEVRNLTFEDYTEDACSFEGGSDQTNAFDFDSQHIWVHHNTFLEGKNYWDVCPEQDKHEGDGATDFKKNSYITISYNHYYMNHKTGLVGGGDTQKTACLTFGCNWYEDCNSRLPLARQANMHMYNNYYDGSTGTNMSLRAGAYAFIENCYFDNAKDPITTKAGDDKDGVAKVYNCTFTGKNISSTYLNITVFIVTDRTKTVTNYNIFNQNFDTDPNYFYYDPTTKETVLDIGFNMLTAEQVKTEIPKLAGVHKN